MELLFWLSGFGAVYSYLFYPLIMAVISTWRPRLQSGNTAIFDGNLSIIITVYNEERRISKKIEQTLELIARSHRVQIIVASDASNDTTEEIVASYSEQGVTLIRSTERRGKEHAQKLAIAEANGEVLIFSDVGTEIEANSLSTITKYFANPSIGAVSSVDQVIDATGAPVGEGLYVRYEMALRRFESKANTLVGLSGSFFAVRRSLCNDWNTTIPSDFNTAMNCVKAGKRAISADDVIGLYPNIEDPAKEYPRKRRTVLRGITAIAANLDFLNMFRYPLFGFQLWSHKVMRWAVPWFQAALLISNVWIVGEHWFYQFTLLAHIALLVVAMVGLAQHPKPLQAWLKFPAFFMQVNIAAAHALLDYIKGERSVTWTPSKR
ncbi:MAG: glycosyltransferase [Immundisolibacteraceae bacterium]|nr:glycosyltransferase [Immundisolibacteraceae bacterium]